MTWRRYLTTVRPGAGAYIESVLALPDLVGMRGTLGALSVYPIKGFGAVRMHEVRIGPKGLMSHDGTAPDRALWLAYRKPGEACGVRYEWKRLSQREDWCLARAAADCDGGWLTYRAQGVEPLRLQPEDLAPVDGILEPVRFFDTDPEIVWGVRMEGEPLRFLRDLIRVHGNGAVRPEDVMVFRPDVGRRRLVGAMHAGGHELETGASDGGYAHVVLRETFGWMNARLGAPPVPVEAARANIVLEGLPANAEDVAYEIEFDCDRRPRMTLESFCVRCSVTMVDPATGDRRKDGQPLAFLTAERPPRPDKGGKGATLGWNCAFAPQYHGQILTAGCGFRVIRER